MTLHRTDTVYSLAADLAARVRWESELGAEGYPPPNPLPELPVSVKATDKTPPSVARSAASPPPASVTSPQAPASDPASALVALRAEIGDCERCGLSKGRTHLVFGDGNPRADLVFVGEGPGRDEDLAGKPFVGAAGQLLDKIIRAMTLDRQDVYICNVVKCRPPSNRVPEPEERRECGAFVLRQIEIISPKVVVALGSTAAQFLLDFEGSLGSVRGRFHQAHGVAIMPTYHPAYLLRNASGKRAVWDDMQMVMRELGLSPHPTGAAR